MTKYASTKTYGANLGLSCAFRQHRADSHCNKLHGYALEFKFVFGADKLDYRNWVVDFGGLKALKQALQDWFDHKTIVAQDDPLLPEIMELGKKGLLEWVLMKNVGCEAFAEFAYGLAVEAITPMNKDKRIKVLSCEVREHGANSAIYKPFA